MPDEKLLLYVVAAAVFLLTFFADVLQRRRERRMEQQQTRREAVAHGSPAQRTDALHDDRAGEARFEPSPPRSVAAKSTVRPVIPSEIQAAARRQRPVVRVEPAMRHRFALGERAELRRAVQLMTILGPPRSRVPEDG